MSRQKVDGVLLLDKPKGISSNAALQTAKYLLQAKKAGHTGSLDPNASGMLPLCFGEATKYSQYLLNADKVYQCEAVFGHSTTTGDVEGEMSEAADISSLTKEMIEQYLPQFIGKIQQTPTMFSALKHKGQPLYKLARRGIEVEREARLIHIREFVCLSYQAPSAEFYVNCSKGTYIRTLIEDLGQALGCGAYVKELRRLSVGHFTESAMVSLDDLRANETQRQQYLLPISAALHNYPTIEIDLTQFECLAQGKILPITGDGMDTLVRVHVSEKGFVGLGELSERGLTAKRLLALGQ